MKVVLTGATGFIGSAVARRLLAEGVALRALVRPNSDRRNIEGLDLEVVEGDLRDEASLARLCQGCDALFHIAADYRLWARRPSEIYQTNVEGTRAILTAAAEAGVSRVVYTSSVATLDPPSVGVPGDESGRAKLPEIIGHYKRSKFMAEEVVRDFARKGLAVVTVNPSAPVGPRDVKPTPTGRTILEAAAGRMPAYVETGLNIVHVDDVAEGHWLAFERGRVGETYVLGGANMTLLEILTCIAELVGREPPRIRLPYNLVLSIAHISESAARLTGKSPVATVEGVKLSKKMMFFSSEKARRELGYAARPPLLALQDAICWFHDNGYLRQPSASRRDIMKSCDNFARSTRRENASSKNAKRFVEKKIFDR
ncbi:hopanoid-associated sugar epimerase [Methylocystis bryophila]|uniref:NAD-dependent dehydratase n=1 Tax=Methylocystis bryophila TaxID=655015 RepID=A0A1W6MWU4_9HYPH|nr:hopanoid-associated sugar epimerase [Methylocystis bryophila]ARN82060.1 NAD-dependent dehydratase [Methylocystis bryophila]BDV38182.1 NAD-dependent dehydratase [Methylocystis bryophila]